MAILYLCSDVNDAIVEGASFGRDCDTIGNVVGSIGGALHGAGAIRDNWIRECERANRDLFEEIHGDPNEDFDAMADRLMDALNSHYETVREHEQMLNELT
jgi:hypothetical protein